MKRYAILAAILLALSMTGQVFAQGSNAALSGAVTDPTKAVIPGVSVTVENTETGVKATTISNEAGWQNREFSFFFKDDFKVSPGFTLNLGVRYEWYGVPYEKHGRNAGVVGGSAGLFGISGTGWKDVYQPFIGTNGKLTDIELVGKHSPNPKKKLYNDDGNNFAPAVGLSWSLPWFGKDKTVLRIGYGIGYEINSLRLLNVVSGDQPGLRILASYRPATLLNLSNFTLPATYAIVGKPLETVPLTDRTQTVRAYDTNLRTPYTQNFNLTIQRELPSGFTLDVRYVGNKGTKLARGVTVNEVNIIETGILDAFKAVQSGGESALLDRIFNGYNLGAGVINGATVRAGAGLRTNSTTRAFFANNSAGQFADYLNTSSNFTGTNGGLLRNGRLPDNYIVANPQFLHSRVTGNFANSTYHSMQIDTPHFDNPNLNINDPNFGRITDTLSGDNGGTRIVVIGARINF